MMTATTGRIVIWGTVVCAFAATMFSCGAASAMSAQDRLLNMAYGVSQSAASETVDMNSARNELGIPAGITGSVSAGQEIFDITCSACHQNSYVLPATTFGGFKRRQHISAMDGLTLSDQETADIVVWLNRFSSHSK